MTAGCTPLAPWLVYHCVDFCFACLITSCHIPKKNSFSHDILKKITQGMEEVKEADKSFPKLRYIIFLNWNRDIFNLGIFHTKTTMSKLPKTRAEFPQEKVVFLSVKIARIPSRDGRFSLSDCTQVCQRFSHLSMSTVAKDAISMSSLTSFEWDVCSCKKFYFEI